MTKNARLDLRRYLTGKVRWEAMGFDARRLWLRASDLTESYQRTVELLELWVEDGDDEQ